MWFLVIRLNDGEFINDYKINNIIIVCLILEYVKSMNLFFDL